MISDPKQKPHTPKKDPGFIGDSIYDFNPYIISQNKNHKYKEIPYMAYPEQNQIQQMMGGFPYLFPYMTQFAFMSQNPFLY